MEYKIKLEDWLVDIEKFVRKYKTYYMTEEDVQDTIGDITLVLLKTKFKFQINANYIKKICFSKTMATKAKVLKHIEGRSGGKDTVDKWLDSHDPKKQKASVFNHYYGDSFIEGIFEQLDEDEAYLFGLMIRYPKDWRAKSKMSKKYNEAFVETLKALLYPED